MTVSITTLRRVAFRLFAVGLLLFACAAHAINWNYLDGSFGGQPFALFIDSNGNTWAGLNGAGVYVRAAGTTSWVYKPGLPTQGNARFVEGNDGTVYVSGSGGLYAWKVGAKIWTQVSGTNGLPGEAAGGLAIDSTGTIYAAMNRQGVWKLPAGTTTWVSTGTGLPSGTNPYDLKVDGAGNVWAALYGIGVSKLAAGSATWVDTSAGLPVGAQITGLLVVGSDLYASIQFGGLYKLANASAGGTAWVNATGGQMASNESLYALAPGANNSIYAVGYGFVFFAASGSTAWTKLGTGIEREGPGFSIVYAFSNGLVTLGNDSGVRDLPAGATVWEDGNAGMGAATIYGLVVAPSGDLYAATFGQGVQRQVRGTTIWTEIDRANSAPVVESIAIDGNGTIYANPGGGVKKLLNDAWVDAGNVQNNFSAVLAIDGANGVWAGQNGQVSKLAAGAGTWTVMSAGLPPNLTVRALALDGTGNAYAGIYGNGVWVLPAGGSTWTQNNTGLDDLNIYTLQRDPGGAVYVGTGSAVYRLASGMWTKVGNTTFESVLSIAFDTNGDIYAGTADYVWRLPAGSSDWIQVKLGLGSRGVYSFALGNGRLYAGTDASRGSRSGVFVLSKSDTVVEFYNVDLDNFFITATTVEQEAIDNGAAGPGWSRTGAVFSAGGAALVCRFYGSQFPGPNSHVYTINPVECQSLKDLAMTTPATEKRWNFESNDFASTSPVAGQCTPDQVAVYRAYNGGFARGIDSNHRITPIIDDYLLQTQLGWIGEGVVMCAPR